MPIGSQDSPGTFTPIDRIPVKAILQNSARQMRSGHLSETCAKALSGERALVDRPQKILLGNQGGFEGVTKKAENKHRWSSPYAFEATSVWRLCCPSTFVKRRMVEGHACLTAAEQAGSKPQVKASVDFRKIFCSLDFLLLFHQGKSKKLK